jgi:riboflavin synthase
MFTGIIEELGEVASLEGGRLEISSTVAAQGSEVGSSVAVNGTCLTVVGNGGDLLAFEISPETFARTTLGGLTAGDRVNLERPLTLSGRLGGHLVQGHVDGVGQVSNLIHSQEGAAMTVDLPGGLLRFVVEKGSIAVDGVSLTVARLVDGSVEIALIPHTLQVTNLGVAREGQHVNLEVDMIAKYVERLMERS